MTVPVRDRIACGFTNNVDVIIALDGERCAALAADVGASLAETPVAVAATPAALLQGLRWFLERGQGGEIPLADAAMADWVGAHFSGRLGLGGTGAQAAQTLARLGRDTLLHVTSLSPAQAALLDDSGRILIPTPAGLRTPAAAARPADPTLTHFIFEYPAGLALPFPDRTVVTSRANRVIVPFSPLHARLPLDPCFLAAVADPAHRVRRALISGYNQIENAAVARARVAETAAAIRRWRQASPDLLVHLELGATLAPEVFATILDDLPPHADSVGFNADELAAILALWGEPEAAVLDGVAGVLAGLRRLRRGHSHSRSRSRSLSGPRLGLHAQDYCLTLTRRDPLRERAALTYASLVAGTRARLGALPTPADLRATGAAAQPSPAGVAAIADLTAAVGLRDGVARIGDDWLVAVPTLAVPDPAGTIGLGDSFTAGLLAAL